MLGHQLKARHSFMLVIPTKEESIACKHEILTKVGMTEK